MGGATDCNAQSLFDNQRFKMPGTTSFADELSSTRALKSAPTQLYIVSFTLVLATLYLWGTVPDWFFMLSFGVWRLAYNVGIGAMLYTQSHGLHFSKWYRGWINKPEYKWIKDKLESGVLLTEDGKSVDYDMSKYSDEFNAWVVFRIFVNIILANDLVSYLVFTLVYFEMPSTLGFQQVAAYIVGVALIAFAVWSKADAHRVLGNYAWYWGDFFFTLEAGITFDGIFQMFPHPMYTVGYAFYYGLSLVSQSYAVFYCSVAAHIAQMIFLVVVENPHIEKIYGKMSRETDKEVEANRVIPTKKEMILIHNLSPYHASDIFTILLLIYSGIVAFSVERWEWHLVHFIAWRLFHTVGLGLIMKKQAESDAWVKQFPTPQFAFDSWKKIYNVSLCMNYVLFVVLSAHCYRFMPDNSFIGRGDYAFYCFKMCCGFLLIGLHYYVATSTYDVLGEFGWFYGDFFIKDIPSKLTYSGIYRYMNNPESVLGFAGFYGLSLLSSSYRVGTVAVCCHISQIVFTKLVEEPFVRAKYGGEVRPRGGLASEVIKKAEVIKAIINPKEKSN